MSDMPEAFRIVAENVGSDTSPEELKKWRITFLLGFTAGYLQERDPQSVDESDPVDVAEVRARSLGISRVNDFIAENPGLSHLEYVRKGIRCMYESYVEAVATEPGLEPSVEMLGNVDRWVRLQPEVDEGFARMALRYAGISVGH